MTRNLYIIQNIYCNMYNKYFVILQNTSCHITHI